VRAALCCCCWVCHRYVATELPLRYRKLVSNTSRCYVIVAGLWTAALVTFIAPLLTKPDWIYYRYNVNEKMCGIHWEYPCPSVVDATIIVNITVINDNFITTNFVRGRKEKEENRGRR